MKPFFTDKGITRASISLIEDEKFFDNAVKSLNLKGNGNYIQNVSVTDPVQSAILKYSNHPSINKINENVKKCAFSFKNINLQNIEDEIKNLQQKKANISDSVPTKDIKRV